MTPNYFKKLITYLAIFGSLMTLSSCSSVISLEKLKSMSLFGEEGQENLIACPQYNILPDTNTLTRFVANKPKLPKNILFTAKLENISLTCNPSDTNKYNAEFSLNGTVNLGVNKKYKKVNLKIFVATTLYENVVDKKNYIIETEIDQTIQIGKFAKIFDDLTIEIYPDTNLSDYIIYFGFELTDEELEYNNNTLNTA